MSYTGGGFINSRTGVWVSRERAAQSVGSTLRGYTKVYNPKSGHFSMQPASNRGGFSMGGIGDIGMLMSLMQFQDYQQNREQQARDRVLLERDREEQRKAIQAEQKHAEEYDLFQRRIEAVAMISRFIEASDIEESSKVQFQSELFENAPNFVNSGWKFHIPSCVSFTLGLDLKGVNFGYDHLSDDFKKTTPYQLFLLNLKIEQALLEQNLEDDQKDYEEDEGEDPITPYGFPLELLEEIQTDLSDLKQILNER